MLEGWNSITAMEWYLQTLGHSDSSAVYSIGVQTDMATPLLIDSDLTN